MSKFGPSYELEWCDFVPFIGRSLYRQRNRAVIRDARKRGDESFANIYMDAYQKRKKILLAYDIAAVVSLAATVGYFLS